MSGRTDIKNVDNRSASVSRGSATAPPSRSTGSRILEPLALNGEPTHLPACQPRSPAPGCSSRARGPRRSMRRSRRAPTRSSSTSRTPSTRASSPGLARTSSTGWSAGDPPGCASTTARATSGPATSRRSPDCRACAASSWPRPRPALTSPRPSTGSRAQHRSSPSSSRRSESRRRPRSREHGASTDSRSAAATTAATPARAPTISRWPTRARASSSPAGSADCRDPSTARRSATATLC